MSMFWWLVKNEQLRYYRNRNAEFQRREKERKQKEEQKKQKRIERERYYSKCGAIENEIKYLRNTIDAILYPTIYNKNNHVIVNRDLLLDLNNRINVLKRQPLEKYGITEITFGFVVDHFQEVKEQYKQMVLNSVDSLD